MSCQADFIYIICTDPRIQKIYHDYLVKNDLFGKFDTIQYENPILDFLDPAKRSAILDRIKLYIELHGATKIVIFDHFDCGAYKKKGGYEFEDKEDEIKKHKENNLKMREILKKNLPELEVEVKYIGIDSNNNCQWINLD